MSEFNLVDEAWIPVRFSNGNREELGIRETLLRAKEIAEIEHQSPLVVASLHRLLLAVLYRALKGPTDIEQAEELFASGLPANTISEYLDKWHARFWLFNGRYPFGQHPSLRDQNVEPWTKLAAEFNGSSSKVLFDHTDARQPGTRGRAACARSLVVLTNFSVGGGRGYFLSPEPLAIFCIPIGDCLAESLHFNLVPYPNAEVMKSDSALWEREPVPLPLSQAKRTATGYADLFSWQSRLVLLNQPSDVGVEFMQFAPGEGCERSPGSIDPMHAYIEIKDKGRFAVKLSDGRDAWREYSSLLPSQYGEGALTVAHAARLIRSQRGRKMPSLLVVAQRNQPPNATIEYWRMERFSLPANIASDGVARTDLRQLLTIAEESQNVLKSTCQSFATDILAHGNRDVLKRDVSAVVKQMRVIDQYWSIMEQQFHGLLRMLQNGDDFEIAKAGWLTAVRDAIAESWHTHSSAILDSNVWILRAFVRAEADVIRELAKLNHKIAELQQPEATS